MDLNDFLLLDNCNISNHILCLHTICTHTYIHIVDTYIINLIEIHLKISQRNQNHTIIILCAIKKKKYKYFE